jgi:hypothetical protein
MGMDSQAEIDTGNGPLWFQRIVNVEATTGVAPTGLVVRAPGISIAFLRVAQMNRSSLSSAAVDDPKYLIGKLDGQAAIVTGDTSAGYRPVKLWR